jgi:hypothetical protein
VKVFNGSNNGPDIDPPDLAARERSLLLWSNRDWENSPRGHAAVGAQFFVTTQMFSTLGYLNERLGTPVTGPMPMLPPTDPMNPPNREFGQDFYIGGPNSPFPWLTWLDRPYVNQYELLQVPARNSEELLQQYNTPSLYQAQPNFLHVYPFFDPSRRHFQLMHYTTVRSRFLGTETFLPPDLRLPRREPGRVNLNTIANEAVWNALWNGIEVPQANGALSSSWIPIFDDPNNMINNTLRNTRQTANGFKVPELTDALNNDALLQMFLDQEFPDSSYPHLNGDVNWYHRFRGMNKLGSIATTHSNVYAVWVTLGFFEVDASTGAVGQEVGADTGSIKRHRAFYIIDRSVPVAFEPGENHNVDRAVLLRRYIE